MLSAGPELLLEAGATEELTAYSVRSRPFIGRQSCFQ